MKRDLTAIILGRAGSKGVPGKNTRMLAGKPCAAWTIDHAARSASIARVIVSTDDHALALVAKGRGAEVIARPPELAGDATTIDDAARHAAEQLDDDAFIILYANVPVRPPDLIDRAAELLTTSGCDSVQSYERVGKHHPWWMARLDPRTGAVSPWEGEILNHGVYRRQDLPPVYLPDGGVIALTRRALFREIPGCGDGPHAFLGADRRGIESPPGSVIDIDAEADLARAAFLLSADALRGR